MIFGETGRGVGGGVVCMVIIGAGGGPSMRFLHSYEVM